MMRPFDPSLHETTSMLRDASSYPVSYETVVAEAAAKRLENKVVVFMVVVCLQVYDALRCGWNILVLLLIYVLLTIRM